MFGERLRTVADKYFPLVAPTELPRKQGRDDRGNAMGGGLVHLVGDAGGETRRRDEDAGVPIQAVQRFQPAFQMDILALDADQRRRRGVARHVQIKFRYFPFDEG